MLVFIDDSGDPGFKLDKGSTKFFIISLVIFDDDLEAEKTAVAIKDLKRELKFHDKSEFKFYKSSKDVRQKFLNKVCGFQFRVRSLVVDKSIIRSKELRSNKNSFYGYVIKTALKYSDGKIKNAKIKIDGSGDRVFRKSFLSYLRRQLNSVDLKIMDNCKLVDSQQNVLIQLADMIAGSVHRSYNTEKDDHKIYKAIIKKRIENEWRFR
ncbi:MAG: DUF3800 domain-containing protein [Candidatus Peregrinibacteria bacterium]|nr:DUF3800 domain-containing protein [Candidatus Peregrinibacteria bacterium]